MHITSDHYRRRGITRIDDETVETAGGFRADSPPAASRGCPLRPSSQTLHRLQRLHHARCTSRHLI